jgi:gamma-glutamyltranspeptidase/glutathione hydrolase
MTMFQALNIIDTPDLNRTDLWSVDFAHTWLEAMKLAFLDDDRYNTAKDDVEIPVERLISKAYAAEQRSKINRGKAARFPGAPLLPIGTTSLATADRSGNVAVLTQSHVSGFGSGVVAGDTGVLLNNGHRFGFVLDADHVNALVGGQVAKGVMCPTLVMKGEKVIMGVGAAGGYTIPQTVGQVITKVLTYGYDIQRAIASPRVILNRGGGRVPITNDEQTYGESGYPPAILAGLEKRGHRLSRPGNGGAVQGVYIDEETGAMAGGSDPRRDGHALAW